MVDGISHILYRRKHPKATIRAIQYLLEIWMRFELQNVCITLILLCGCKYITDPSSRECRSTTVFFYISWPFLMSRIACWLGIHSKNVITSLCIIKKLFRLRLGGGTSPLSNPLPMWCVGNPRTNLAFLASVNTPYFLTHEWSYIILNYSTHLCRTWVFPKK